MPTQYTLIRLGDIAMIWEVVNTMTKDEMAATEEVCDLLTSGETFAIIETIFDKGKVSEFLDVTNDVIEIAASKWCEPYSNTDDLPRGVPAWVKESDAFDALPQGPDDSACARADRWHDERVNS